MNTGVPVLNMRLILTRISVKLQPLYGQKRGFFTTFVPTLGILGTYN